MLRTNGDKVHNEVADAFLWGSPALMGLGKLGLPACPNVFALANPNKEETKASLNYWKLALFENSMGVAVQDTKPVANRGKVR